MQEQKPFDDDQQADEQDPQRGEGAPAGDPVLEADLRKLQEERDALFERLARVSADFKNAQKRLEDDKRQAIEYANSSLIKALLPVIDSFERALVADASKIDAASVLKGMQIVHDQWLAILKQQQVQPIAPKPGDGFDPNLHQALMQQESEQFAKTESPVVVMLLQKGYAHRDRVIRPAQVAVNKIEG
jgi:molecular chaperone GrpE